MPNTLIVKSVLDCNVPDALKWFAPVVDLGAAAWSNADTIADNAYPEVIRDYLISNTNCTHLYHFGHGLGDCTTCNECYLFIGTGQWGEYNLDLCTGRSIHLLSCLTAQRLAKSILDAGATEYYGYKQEVLGIFEDTADPGNCRFMLAAAIGDPEIEKALSEGKNILEAYDQAVARWDEEIRYWEDHYDEEQIPTAYGNVYVDENVASMLITLMTHNRNALVAANEAGSMSSVTPLTAIAALAAVGVAAAVVISGAKTQYKIAV
jgi:hypothetical protein